MAEEANTRILKYYGQIYMINKLKYKNSKISIKGLQSIQMIHVIGDYLFAIHEGTRITTLELIYSVLSIFIYDKVI